MGVLKCLIQTGEYFELKILHTAIVASSLKLKRMGSPLLPDNVPRCTLKWEMRDEERRGLLMKKETPGWSYGSIIFPTLNTLIKFN